MRSPRRRPRRSANWRKRRRRSRRHGKRPMRSPTSIVRRKRPELGRVPNLIFTRCGRLRATKGISGHRGNTHAQFDVLCVCDFFFFGGDYSTNIAKNTICVGKPILINLNSGMLLLHNCFTIHCFQCDFDPLRIGSILHVLHANGIFKHETSALSFRQ